MKKYNILDDACEMNLLPDKEGRNKYVSQEMIKKCLNYDESLLISGAGSGKTTAIYEYVKNNTSAKVVLTVPTTLLAKNLDEKYGNEKFVSCFYNNSNHKFNNERLVIMTYDKFSSYKDKLTDYILITDEVHEGHQFKAINEQKRALLDIMFSSPNQKIHLTASPFNLCKSSFDNIIFGKQDLNKKMFNIYASDTRGCLKNAKEHIIASGHKCLIFINSKAYAKKMEEDLKEQGFKVLTIFSENQEDEEVIKFLDNCSNINNWNDKIDYDHIIVSKVMNIGYDLNYIFDEIVYINPQNNNICINSFLQISARDRQTLLVSAFYNNSKNKNYATNINNFNEDININQNVNTIDKKRFNNTYNIYGEIDKNYSVSTKNYNSEYANFEEVKEVLNSLYTNFIINHFILDNGNFDSTIRQTLPTALKNMNITAPELLELFYENDTKEIYSNLTTNNQIKLTKLLHTLTKHSIQPTVLANIKTEEIIKINIHTNYGLKNSPKVVAALDSFLNKDYYTPEYITKLCDILNSHNLKVNGKEWTNKNFKRNMEHFGVHMKQIILNKEQCENEGYEFSRTNRKKALINSTIQMSELIKESEKIQDKINEDVAEIIINHSDEESLLKIELHDTLITTKEYRNLFLNEKDIHKKIEYNNKTNELSKKLLEIQAKITTLQIKNK